MTPRHTTNFHDCTVELGDKIRDGQFRTHVEKKIDFLGWKRLRLRKHEEYAVPADVTIYIYI